MYYPFLGDEFLRLMVLRYVFCESVLRMHRSFRARTNLPRAYPPLPDDLFEHRDLVSIVLQMADYIGVSFKIILLIIINSIYIRILISLKILLKILTDELS